MQIKRETKGCLAGTILLLGLPTLGVACGGNSNGEGTTSGGEVSTEETDDATESDDSTAETDETSETEPTSGSDTDETSGATTGDGEGDAPDLDACLEMNFDFADAPLNTIEATQKEELCTWYQGVWECALDYEAMCTSEGLQAGAQVLSASDDGIATCQDAQQKCLDNGPQALETLRSCLEVDVITGCDGSLADYMLCMRANFKPLDDGQLKQYTCSDVSAYAEKNGQQWVSPEECETFTATCDFGNE